METLVIKETEAGIKICDFCHAEEGKLRLVGRFKVELRTVDVFGTKKLACQSCAHKHNAVIRSRKKRQEIEIKDRRLFHLKKFISLVVHACILLVVLSAVTMAQPPMLPTAPSQAPIDGGLSLLAAAGGAYAMKKLRDKKTK